MNIQEPRGHVARRMLEADPNAKLKDIAQQLGLSRGHVWQIKQRIERLRRRQEQAAARLPITDDSDLSDLTNQPYVSVRTRNVVRNDYDCLARDYGSGDKITVAQARLIPDWHWLRVHNFGRKSLAELRALLGTEESPGP